MSDSLGIATAGRLLSERLLADLLARTSDPPGVTRAAYGAGEQVAHDLVRAQAERLGCVVRVDAVGNLYATKPGSDRSLPALMIGSHLDAVPHGGNFDGAAGIAAGLALLANLAELGIVPAFDITVAAFRAEEAAWFPLSYPGSSAAIGRLDPQFLAARRSDTGRSLEQHMIEAGFDPSPVRERRPLIDVGRIGAFIEVHIEQGPVLTAAGLPAGLVTGLAGGLRFGDARIMGTYAHSGATPRHDRQDAVLAFANLVAGLEALWDRLEHNGQLATITIGKVATDPAQHAASKVAGELCFALDVRSASASILNGMGDQIRQLCRRVNEARGVRIDLGAEFTWPAVQMTGALLAELEDAAGAAGIATMRLPSGAGHDAAVLADAGVATAMLFVRNARGSHNPDEAMELSDLDQAVQILTRLVVQRCPGLDARSPTDRFGSNSIRSRLYNDD